MKLQITGITEDEVVSASALLDESGFQYDEDYTTLYGAGWAVVGIEFTNADAAAVVVARYSNVYAN